jgi:uncharacterized protein (TIGR03118 family)
MNKYLWALAGGMMIMTACRKNAIDNKDLRDFQQVNLVANNTGYGAQLVDPNLRNAWGLAWAPSGIAWVDAQAGHVSELFTGQGASVRPPVAIPSPGDTIGGNPTGIVFNSTKGFKLANGNPASFIFVGVDGVVSAWNGGSGNRAQRIANNSATSVYTGLALAASGGHNFIYAANFRAGTIDVWDTSWSAVWMPFHDGAIPAGYAPFNVQAVSQWLFVTYAKVGPDGHQAVGAGEGFVDIFNTDGSFVRRFASREWLNAPWGVTITPAGFLEESDMSGGKADNGQGQGEGKNDVSAQVILVGNFGDGRINVFTLAGVFQGQLQSQKKTVVIDGLWAVGFAPTTATSIDPMRLYFTAGPAKETDGLFGYLRKQ